MPYNIARALVEGLVYDFEADDAPLRYLLPGPRQSFREAVAEAFETEARQTLVSRWSERAFAVRHQRHHPVELRIGGRVDSWSVIGIEPQSRLSLAFGMCAPGAGMLELTLTPVGEGQTRVTATAYWHPAGVWGLLCWYALAPAHLVIFKGMTREICARGSSFG